MKSILVPNPGFEIYSATNDTDNANFAIAHFASNSTYYNSSHLRYYETGRYCLDWEGYAYCLRNRCWDSLGYDFFRGGARALGQYETTFDTANLTHSGMSSANLFIGDGKRNASYLWAKLKDTLCKGCEYRVSFYVYVTQGSNVIFPNIGLLFCRAPDSVDDNGDSKYFLRNIEPLKQGVWQKIEFNYVAMGYESSVYISKYNSTIKVKVLKKNQSMYYMSIYVDDVVVEKIEEEGEH